MASAGINENRLTSLIAEIKPRARDPLSVTFVVKSEPGTDRTDSRGEGRTACDPVDMSRINTGKYLIA